MFHSSFIAWLLNKSGEHGFGSSFAKRLLNKIGYEIGNEYDVFTEYTESHCRFDIFVKPIREGTYLILENKIKSFGNVGQIESYKNLGHRVAFLALLEETIEATNKIDVIHYRDVLEALEAEKLVHENPYHFLIEEYKKFIKNHLRVYDAIKSYCEGKILWKQATKIFAESLKDIEIKDNDARTYIYYFYFNFVRYIRGKSSSLIFGDLCYKEAEERKENTRWIFEKNMQGPPYLEVLINNPNQSGMKFSLNSDLLEFHKNKNFVIAPRIEIWLNPKELQDKSEDFPIGLFMIGTWNQELKDFLRQKEPYKSELKRRGRRNFHQEQIHIKDLVFENFEKRIKEVMMKIGAFED